MPHRMEVAHHIPGRVRLKVRRAKGDAATLERIRAAIAALPEVQDVSANPATGSLLVTYDRREHPRIESTLAENGDGTDTYSMDLDGSDPSEIMELVSKEAEFLEHHSQTGLAVVNLFRSLDKGIREATGNMVDLKVLLPAGLAIWSFTEVGIDMSTPMWVTLGLSSFNSFVALHRHPAGTGAIAPQNQNR